MRHRVYGKHLGRNKDERDTLFKGLLKSLLTYGTIQTSEAKAKAIKGLVDKVINFSKDKKRQHLLQSFLIDKNLRDRLIKEIVPKISNRNSGYTSLVRLGSRFGDQTMMVKMSLIGAEELKPLEKVTSNKRPIRQAQGKQVISKKAEQPKKVISKKKVVTKKPVAKRRVVNKK